MNSKIALVLAIILGAFAAVSVKYYIAGVEKNVQDQNTKLRFLVAKTSITANQLLKASDIDFAYIEKKYFNVQNMLTSEDTQEFINKQIYYDVSKGGVLLRSYFLPRGNASSSDNSILDTQSASAKLKPFERAVTLKVDQLSGVAMLLKPGDFVDVFWTGQTSPEISKFLGINTVDVNANVDKLTVLLLSDVYIMALDNRYSLSPTVARNRIVNAKENYGSVTVRCKSYEEAKMLIHAQMSGKLTLVKKGEDQLVIDNDEAVDVLQMLKASRKVNAARQKDKTNN